MRSCTYRHICCSSTASQPQYGQTRCPVAAVTFIECLTPVSVLSCNVRGCHASCSSHSCACDTSIVTKFCLQNARCMSSKARGGVVALHGQGDEQTASEQLSSLVSDIVVSADGVWAALALHQRVEVFNIKTAKHHGHLPVFEVSQSALSGDLTCVLTSPTQPPSSQHGSTRSRREITVAWNSMT